MKYTLLIALMVFIVTLAAFDLEYIKPVPVDGAKKEVVKEEQPPQKADVLYVSTQDALTYVSSLNYKDYDQELLKNAYLGNTEVVKILLERDANPNYQLPGAGVSVLQAALYNNHAEISNLLLDKGASCIHWDNFDRFGLCYTAITHGNLDLVSRIREKTDLIYRDKLWRTAAIYAAVYENMEVLDWLAENYGPLNDYKERGPGDYAAANCKLNILKEMQTSGFAHWNRHSALKYAIAAGAVDIVEYLLSLKETAPDASDLIVAALGEQSFYDYDIQGMQVCLIDPGDYILSGHDPEELVYYNTPQNYQAIFSLLMPLVDINARDGNDITPLIACAMANDASQAKILLELGASPYLRYKGQTPLDIALANPDADPDLISMLKAAMK